MTAGEERAFSSAQRGKNPLANPFLFVSAITFLSLLNGSIDYEEQVPHNSQKQKTKRQNKESKNNMEEKTSLPVIPECFNQESK